MKVQSSNDSLLTLAKSYHIIIKPYKVIIKIRKNSMTNNRRLIKYIKVYLPTQKNVIQTLTTTIYIFTFINMETLRQVILYTYYLSSTVLRT
jgi:hypothetical protein